jgi:hypothetical protein
MPGNESKRVSQVKEAKGALGRYFTAYGGWLALIKSPFLWCAAAVSILLIPTWNTDWAANSVLSVVPAMLGFSIAAFTFSLGIGTDKFRILMGRRFNGQSIVGALSVSFVHFVVVQVVSLLFSFVARSHWVAFFLGVVGVEWQSLPSIVQLFLSASRWLLGGISTLIFVYAILCALPAIFGIYDAASSFQAFAELEKDEK